MNIHIVENIDTSVKKNTGKIYIKNTDTGIE